jgi:predicted RNA-binding Zn-ribbon protein involved in translation (DUF1610 family)
VNGKVTANALWVVIDIPFDHKQYGKTMPCPICGSVMVLRAWKEKSRMVFSKQRVIE